jgi:hypothetical protein
MKGETRSGTRMWERRGVDKVKWGNLRERDHLKDPGREEADITMDLQEVRWGNGQDRSGSGQK